MNEILKLYNISKQYKQGKAIIEVLNNVNLTIKQGELVAIIGASGSGKSTLLHIAGLLDVPDSGLVEIVSNKSSNKDLLRLHNIGFVYQQHNLLKDFTALENIAMPRLIAGADYKLALKDARQLLSALGLEGKINNIPGELSGGEQQRVAVARAMINNPKVILADEPTGNLDPNTAEEVFNLFLQTASVKNTAMIIVTHNHEIAKRMHNVYELQNGMLQEV